MKEEEAQKDKEEKENSFPILNNNINNENNSISNIDTENATEDNNNSTMDIKDNKANAEKEHSNNYIKEIKNLKLNKIDFIDSLVKCGINMKYNSIKFNGLIQNKSKLPLNDYRIFKVFGSGNCFYKCLSQFLYGKVDYHEKLKKAIYEYCKININEINNLQNEIEILKGKYMKSQDYINEMDNNKYLATEIDIIISCYIFSINIIIYRFIDDITKIEYIDSYIYEDNNLDIPLMLLGLYVPGDYKQGEPYKCLMNEKLAHFNLVYPKREFKPNNSNDKNNQLINNNNTLTNNTNNPNIPNLPNIPNMTDTEIYNDYMSIYNIVNEKKHLYIDSNPFPKYTMGHDENLYLNIYNFLEGGLTNGKRKWPDYIEYIKEKKIRNKKKLDFYRKVGLVRVYKRFSLPDNDNDENSSVGRIDTQDKYVIENNRLYLTRYEYNNNSPKKLVFKKYMIPFKNEIDDIINRYHNENHDSLDRTMENIKTNNYYWISMFHDVGRFIKTCVMCGGYNPSFTSPLKNID